MSPLRVLALFEPVGSDLRRLATILKVSRDWERIADLAARIARRAASSPRTGQPTIPEALKSLGSRRAHHSCASYEALAGRDSARAREVILGEHSRRIRSPVPLESCASSKESLRQHPAVRSLARVDEHGAEPRTNRRPCQGYRGRRSFTSRGSSSATSQTASPSTIDAVSTILPCHFSSLFIPCLPTG